MLNCASYRQLLTASVSMRSQSLAPTEASSDLWFIFTLGAEYKAQSKLYSLSSAPNHLRRVCRCIQFILGRGAASGVGELIERDTL